MCRARSKACTRGGWGLPRLVRVCVPGREPTIFAGMYPTTQLTPSRIAAAFAVAVLADFVQLPLNLLTFTGVLAIPAEFADVMIDVGVCAAVSALLGGFHWILAPAFLAEVVPGVDAIPTWSMAVGAVVWLRKQEAARANEAAAQSESHAIALRPTRAEVVVPATVTTPSQTEVFP